MASRPTEVDERGDRIVVVSDAPGRLRVAAFGVLLILLLFGGWSLQLVPPLLASGRETLVSLLLEVLTTWWVIALLGLSVFLLVMDGRSRRRTVWNSAGVSSCQTYGPLTLFRQQWRHADLPPLEIREIGPIAGAGRRPHTTSWRVGWPVGHRGRGSRQELFELARFASAEEARALTQALLTWSPPRVARATLDDAPLTTRVLDRGVQWLLGMPLVALVGVSLAMVGLAAEAFAVRSGRVPMVLPWDGVAEAQWARFAARTELVSSRRQIHGVVEDVAQPMSTLQIEVRFVDANGIEQVRPLVPLARTEGALPRLRDPRRGGAPLLADLARIGWVPEQIVFELPRGALGLPLDTDDAFRFGDAQTDPLADVRSPAFILHWAFLARVDAPSDLLPLRWLAPAPQAPLRIVYRDAPGTAVWLADEAAQEAAKLQDFDGLVYVIGLFGLMLGTPAFLTLLAGYSNPLRGGVWLCLLAATWWWSPQGDLPEWTGIDRGLQARMRAALVEWQTPESIPLDSEEPGLSNGVWIPENSRYAELLRVLELLERPATPAPDLAAARAAIEAQAARALARLDDRGRDDLLSKLPARQLRQEGNTWLLQRVIAPGVCRWFPDPALAPLAARHADALDVLGCRVG